MKTILTAICLLLFSKAYQQSESVGQPFVLKASTQAKFQKFIQGISVDTVLQPQDNVMVQENVLYILQEVDKANKLVYFYAKNFSKNHPEPAKVNTKEDKKYYYNDKLFSMSYDDYKAKAKDVQFPDEFNFGVLTLPFKFRPQKGEAFDPQFNLNATIGYLLTKKYYKKTKVYLQGGAGIGSANLDETNARGVEGDESQNVSTITGFVGLMMQHSDIQAGIYIGADKINNNKKFDWEHQGNMWISLGVGFKIFTLSKEDKAQ